MAGEEAANKASRPTVTQSRSPNTHYGLPSKKPSCRSKLKETCIKFLLAMIFHGALVSAEKFFSESTHKFIVGPSRNFACFSVQDVEKASVLFIALVLHILLEIIINPASLILRTPSLNLIVPVPEIMPHAAVVEVEADGVVRHDGAAVVFPVEIWWVAGSFGGEERVHGSIEEKAICLLLWCRPGITE
jgi:hypothetical protein